MRGLGSNALKYMALEPRRRGQWGWARRDDEMEVKNFPTPVKVISPQIQEAQQI
jgi:hypothetical protein